jgi:hypothetical protein
MVNWKRFAALFVLFNFVFLLSGCSASWVGAIQALMPAISAAVSALFAFIGALTGKTIPPSVTAFVQKVEADVSTELTNVSNILSTITANASQTVLQQIEAVFNSIVSNLNSILAGLNVTDTSTIGKITNLVGLAIAAIEAVLTLLPLAMKAESLSEAEQVHADKAATTSIKNTHKVLQSTYHIVVTTPTENVDVNTALAALPQTLP